ncbi:hypothetical protein K2173_018875 [Erythroxylum novogranatense]|uniref:Uncharacterized protein n=1 Tax=Erythroxylum novogranatense TaxID=1862640 RepID=A0AAV8SBN1_9ROSI|nr:hypothetical protein K2173_018875 [Erythroxylum novogranatense]
MKYNQYSTRGTKTRTAKKKMSFLAGRLAGKEGAYFFQESKHAVNRLAEKSVPSTGSKEFPTDNVVGSQADVLPEVLRHSLPSNIYGEHSKASSASSFSTASKWTLRSASDADSTTSSFASSDLLNPLRAYVSLPRVTFGPKRWELPGEEHWACASTANELRKDKYTPVSPDKLKAASQGLTQLGKAFIIATVIVFGGATLVLSWAASKLELHNSDDIRTKGKDLVQPKFETIRQQLAPLRTWAEDRSSKWRLDKGDDVKEKPIVKELSKILGAKTSS